MLDPVTGAALVGVSAWFGNKLLGPTADALGQQLKIFATARWESIFKKIEEVNGDKPLKPLPPAFAYIALQHAAIAEDSERITDMWAYLLLAASKGYSHSYMNFVDILAQLGAREVELLDGLVPEGAKFSNPVHAPVNLKSSIRNRLRGQFKAVCVEVEIPQEEMVAQTQTLYDGLISADLGWPGTITAVEYPYSDIQNKRFGTMTGGRPLTTSHDILVRQRLLEPFNFDLNQSFSSPYVEGYLVTILGVEFVLTCRGERP